MSSLARFEIGGVRYKVLIYERGTKQGDCKVCKKRRYGLLVRFKDPVVKDTHICHECIIKLAYEIPTDKEIAAGQAVKVKPKAKKKKQKVKRKSGFGSPSTAPPPPLLSKKLIGDTKTGVIDGP